jgi:cob(I)alamin adenosyltransferase
MKTGDLGWSELLFGRRVRKDDPRLCAVGTLDELNSFLGLAKCRARRKRAKELIHSCQYDLFIVGSELAAMPQDLRRLEFRVDEAMVRRIEQELQELERRVKLEECCFLIPGESEASALLDVCRCVARRAEREVVAIRRRMAVPQRVLVYLNRLSDLLYLLARSEGKARTPFVAGRASVKSRRRRR